MRSIRRTVGRIPARRTGRGDVARHPLTSPTSALMINAVVDDLAGTLTALGDPTRRRVIELLQG
ncbi:MAG: hypothetical protein PV358_11810, partial [Acidimicrobiales bacterium]|nr:hypothetical protein [Acidimicrobiales bacterium]